MKPKTAQIIFVVLNILSLFAVAYVLYDYIWIKRSITDRVDVIYFDSGIYYFLLMSVFWWMFAIQYEGLRKAESKFLKHANQIIIVWFIFMLILANIIPVNLKNKMQSAGYVKCVDGREISRVSKGESSFYKLGGCE